MKKVVVINYTGRKGGGPLDAYEMTKAMIENNKYVIAVISDFICNLNMWRELKLERLILVHTYDGVPSLMTNSLFFKVRIVPEIENLKYEYEIEYIYCPMICFWTKMINDKIGQDVNVCISNHDPVLHSGDRYKLFSNLYGMQKVYNQAQLIIVHSKKFIDYVEKRYNKKGRVLYLPLGRHDFYRGFNIDGYYKHYRKGYINFLFFGRIEEYKGLDMLLNAYESILKKYSRVTLTIAGSGDCSRYKKQMLLLGVNLENYWIEDSMVGEFFSGPDVVLILPYKDATQSGPAFVALEYKVPVISTNVGGLSEQIEDGKTGILISSDVQSLIKAMESFFKDPSLAQSFREGIKQKMNELDWRKSALLLNNYMMNNSAKKDT